MRTREAVTDEKLRGGFYSPEALVDLCWRRVGTLLARRTAITVLEPSVGDGAFIRGLDRNESLRRRVGSVTGVEVVPGEAAKARRSLAESDLRGHIHERSALAWYLAPSSERGFDAAVGNPPYLRFQFLTEDDKNQAGEVMEQLGAQRSGVANLWIPLLMGALVRLRDGGAFAFIIPAESFTGVSARALRHWLAENARRVKFDLFPPGSFPAVLQEVVVLSGRFAREKGERLIEIEQHQMNGKSLVTSHAVSADDATWTQYLLSPAQLDALEEVRQLTATVQLKSVARFEVSTVTGANEFFSVTADSVRQHELTPWARPLLARIRHARGLTFTRDDHAETVAEGLPAFLLDFGLPGAEPRGRASDYLREGLSKDLHTRYKCRIRTPWYRVPVIPPGTMMLSKRSHLYHRVVLNDAEVVTTDTIYRGAMVESLAGREKDFVASFHNSLTLLSAEINGRSFGGGVLELVPSEIARLLIVDLPGFGVELDRLDRIARESASETDSLVEETDRLLTKANIGLSARLLDTLHAARLSLAQRRFERN